MKNIDSPEKFSFREPTYTRIKPEYCAFPLLGSPWFAFQKESYRAVQQIRNLLGTAIQVFEVDAKEHSQIKFRIKQPTGFLLFLLRGTLVSFKKTDKDVSAVQSPVYCFRYHPAGVLSAQFEKGHHTVLLIGLEKQWFIPSTMRELQDFRPLLKHWFSKSTEPYALQEKIISVEVWKSVDQIRRTLVSNMDDMLTILNDVARCVRQYHKQLSDPRSRQIQEDLARGQILKEYLWRNLMFEEECRVERILKNLDWPEWTLRRVAKRALGCSVGRYITSQRIKKALGLLEDTDTMVREIAIEIGYSSAAAFIRAFKKNIGSSPSEYRKRKKFN